MKGYFRLLMAVGLLAMVGCAPGPDDEPGQSSDNATDVTGQDLATCGKPGIPPCPTKPKPKPAPGPVSSGSYCCRTWICTQSDGRRGCLKYRAHGCTKDVNTSQCGQIGRSSAECTGELRSGDWFGLEGELEGCTPS